MQGDMVVNTLRKTMTLMDKRLINHGERVAYVLYHMLKCDRYNQKADQDKIIILGLLHDIGAYCSNEIDNMLTFDSTRVWSHSIYGYLYLKYLSPLSNEAAVILYHHLDYKHFSTLDFPMKEISMYLNIADRLDISLLNGKKFDKNQFEQHRGERFSPEGLDLLYQAEERYSLSGKLADGSYEKEMAQLIKGISLSEKESKGMLRLLVHAIDFMHENTVYRTITTNIAAMEIAEQFGMERDEMDRLYYASVIYDIGMLSIPSRIVDTDRQLTDAERKLVNCHVKVMEKLLKPYMPGEVLNIAARHHEWQDGTGYPKGIGGKDFTLSEKILQAADVVGALSCKNKWRDALYPSDIARVLTEEAMKGHLDSTVARVFSCYEDQIVGRMNEIREETLADYHTIKEQFPQIVRYFEKYNQ